MNICLICCSKFAGGTAIHTRTPNVIIQIMNYKYDCDDNADDDNADDDNAVQMKTAHSVCKILADFKSHQQHTLHIYLCNNIKRVCLYYTNHSGEPICYKKKMHMWIYDCHNLPETYFNGFVAIALAFLLTWLFNRKTKEFFRILGHRSHAASSVTLMHELSSVLIEHTNMREKACNLSHIIDLKRQNLSQGTFHL